MKVYVTKYALTRGILLMEVTDKFESNTILYSIKYGYFNKGDHFKNIEEAIKDAEQRKEKKLIQLQNQLEKLENKNVTIIKEV